MKRFGSVIKYIMFLACIMIPFSCSALTITVDLDTATDEDLLQLLDMIQSKLKYREINTSDVLEEKSEIADNKSSEMINTQVDKSSQTSVKETNTVFDSNAWISEEAVSLKKEPAFASDTICKLVYQQKIYIMDEVDKYVKWYHVKLDNGTTGYVLAVQVKSESNYQESEQNILSNIVSNNEIESNVDVKDVFTIRNGIKMGMTRDEIKKRESLPLERDTVASFIGFGPGEILGIPNSTVEYRFDGSGKLNAVNYSLGKDIKTESSVYANYKKAIESLTLKYGQPLDIPSGQNYEYVTSLLGTLLPASLALDKIAPAPHRYEYKEWALQYETGLIKIECLYSFSKGKNGVSSYCMIEFKFFENKSDPAFLNDI